MTHIIIRAITSQLGSVWETIIWNYASIAWISSFYSRASLNPFPHFALPLTVSLVTWTLKT